MSAEEFRRQLEAISAEYRRELPAKLGNIEALWRGLADDGAKPDRLAELQRELHTIAGSARTFGVAGVSEAAAAAEAFIEPLARKRKLPGAAQREEFGRLLDTLKKASS